MSCGRSGVRVSALLAVALLLALAWPAIPPAAAQPAPPVKVTLAFFAPQLDFASPLERSDWYAAVARHLGAAAGVTVEAKGFARPGDLEGYLARQRLALAVVDAQFGLAAGWVPLLQAVGEDGRAAQPMALVSRSFRSLPALRGKTLMLTGIGGGERELVQGLVLAGELPPSKFFGRLVVAPDAPSAAAAVSLGKADAALLGLALARARGLDVVFTTEDVPLPLLMSVSKGFPDDLRQRLVAGMAGAPGGGGVAGWRQPDAGLLASFMGRLGRAHPRPLVPASLPWLPLRDAHEGAAARAGGPLPLEPGPAAELFDLPIPASRADFAPYGRLAQPEGQPGGEPPPGEKASTGRAAPPGAQP